MKKLFFFSLFFFLFIAPHASAVSLSVEVPKGASLRVGEQKEFDVLLEADGTPLNVIQGTLLFPPDILEVQKIVVDGSVVDFWIDKPSVQAGGNISWSGIIPGGWNGTRSAFYEGARAGILLKIFFRAKKTGQVSLSFEGVDAKANDGKGTDIPVSGSPMHFSVEEGSALGYPPNASQDISSTTEYSTARNDKEHAIIIGAILLLVLFAGFAFYYEKRKH